jgi:alpha-L-fucosidase
MSLTRRELMNMMAGAIPAWRALQKTPQLSAAPDIRKGPFQGTWESLKQYRIPEWFGDAKFGIWAHWGPQSAPEAGDWYARNMYIEGERQYKYHLEHYGHPSKFGFKDIVPTWKGEKFDPDYLVGLYKKAGAKYFMSMGVHHDNFDLWDSRHNRWNSVQMGPKKDIVGLFRDAALKHGLKFGVSDHLWISYKWFAVSHLADKTGPYAGVSYDGADPKYADLYHQINDPKLLDSKLDWDESGIPESWKQHWFLRIKDLVDRYQPDLLYSDGHLPFQSWGRNLVANLYNLSAARNGGVVEAVYTSKRKEDSDAGVCVLDRERGVPDEILPNAWQTDTCIGEWHYRRDITYKTPKMIIDMLVDIVSKNGNLMLNFPLPSSGMLDDTELKILGEITSWMGVNGEAIYGTQPWKMFGNPSPAASSNQEVSFNEKNRRAFTENDVRFTTKEQTVYAFVMGWGGKESAIVPLSSKTPGKIEQVELLGSPGKLQWTRDEAALVIQLPEQKPCEHAVAFRISGTGLV